MADERPKDPRTGQKAVRIGRKPDFGERTYRGHARLSGRVALITGADSGIGRAVAVAFAREVFLASDAGQYVSAEIRGVTGAKPLA